MALRNYLTATGPGHKTVTKMSEALSILVLCAEATLGVATLMQALRTVAFVQSS
jgi:hypothetical protein